MRGKSKSYKALMVVVITLFIVTVVAICFVWSTKKPDEGVLAETEQVTEKSTQPEENDVPDSGTLQETETMEEEAEIPISNLFSYAASLGVTDNSVFTGPLTAFTKQNGVAATAGEIFYTYLPETEPDSMQYYVQLNDPAQTIVILTWHKNEQLVTTSRCSYTRDEVTAQIWDNLIPSDRDVPPEAESGFYDAAAGTAEAEEVVQ